VIGAGNFLSGSRGEARDGQARPDHLAVRARRGRAAGGDFKREVPCDGTSITTFLECAGGERPGCWAHARSDFAKAARAGDSLALEGLRLVAPLFAIERACRQPARPQSNGGRGHERTALRRSRASASG
jgi:hypothetical protein